jgi:hypothetical protein
MQEDKSILDSNVSPYKQLLIALGLAVALMVLSKVMPTVPYSKTSHLLPWTSLCGAILFYAITNCILSFGAGENKNYWLQSIICYVILLFAGGVIAWMVTGVGIFDAGTVSWIYVVLSLGYLVFLSIVNVIKFVVFLAQREDK